MPRGKSQRGRSRSAKRQSVRPAEDDKAKAALISLGNLAICGLVGLVFASKSIVDLLPQVKWHVLFIYVGFELTSITVYWLVALRGDLPDLLPRAFYALRGEEHTPVFRRRKQTGWMGVWIPVYLNFAAFGYLILWTGGATDSPFAPIPLVMASFGQVFVQIPEVKLKADRNPGERSIFYTYLFVFRFSILLVILFYAAILAIEGCLPGWIPDDLPHAKTFAYIFVNTGIFFIGLVLALWSPQPGAQNQSEKRAARNYVGTRGTQSGQVDQDDNEGNDGKHGEANAD